MKNPFRKLKIEPDFQIDRKDKYKVKFVRVISGTPNVVSVKKIRKFTNTVHEKDMSFVIDFNCPTYREGNTFWFMFDIERGQLVIDASGKIVAPSLNHMILKRQGIRQLVMSTEKRKMMDIIVYIILAIAVGIMGGFLLHMGITGGIV